MLQEIILIDSARFDFARVRLDRDLFFLGDNGSGKTSFIRAIHYLYSADQRSLGIPPDKLGFKNYYFPYENSYIIYVFREFFILLYKRQNEIVKIFSKQPFELDRILHNNTLLDTKAIVQYAKSVPNKVVRGVSDYQEILYGINRSFLDFKIADIKSVDIFLNLYNQLFNIDKAIIDSKSIKKAIQTSLNLDEKLQQFNASEYLQKIREFEANYRFFKEFERRKKDIDKAYRFKKELLEMESSLFTLAKKIHYRIEYEKKLQQQHLQTLQTIKSQLQTLSQKEEFLHNVFERIQKRCKEKELFFEKKVALIQELQERFASKHLSEAQELVAQRSKIEREFHRVTEELLKVHGEFASVQKSLEDEIDELKRKREHELPQEMEYRLQLVKNRLQEEFIQKKEELALASEQAIATIEQKIQNHQNRIEKDEALIETIEQELETLLVQKEHDIAKIYQDIQQLTSKKEEELQKARAIQQEKRATIEKIREEIYKAKRLLKTTKQKHGAQYKKELRQLKESIQALLVQIYTKPGSFKEFLNENIPQWQKNLYPILDSALLDKAIDELQPKIIHEPIVGIKLDTQHLKKLLTKDEVKEHLLQKQSAIKALKESFYSTIGQLNTAFMENLVDWQTTIKRLSKEIALHKEALEARLQELDRQKELLEAQKIELVQQYQEKQKALKAKKERLRTQQKNYQNAIKELQKSIKAKKEQTKRKIAKEASSLQTKLQKEQNRLQEWLQQQQRNINETIAQKQAQIATLSKDERIMQLQRHKEEIEKRLNQIYQAQTLLDDFKLHKEELARYAFYQNMLFSVQSTHKRLHQRYKTKVQALQSQKEKLERSKKEIELELAKIQKGLETPFENFTKEKEQTEVYLVDLLEEFAHIQRRYRDKKVDLKEVLDKIGRHLRGFYQIQADFRFSEFEEEFVSNMVETLARIDELYEFRQKQFEINKEGESVKFHHFIDGILTNQLNLFSRNEDKFLTQVAKINKNLAKVDFGVIKHIKLVTKMQEKKSIASMLRRLKEQIVELRTFFQDKTLFYDANDAQKILVNLQSIFLDIKKELKGDAISLVDTIELSLEFEEGGILKQNISQIKNESSTGGSILLKMAIAISILKLFIKEKSDFFLIVDEVSRLHSQNQERLRRFANENGFKIIFVTPEPTFANPEAIQYYKFAKKEDGFEVIELNRI